MRINIDQDRDRLDDIHIFFRVKLVVDFSPEELAIISSRALGDHVIMDRKQTRPNLGAPNEDDDGPNPLLIKNLVGKQLDVMWFWTKDEAAEYHTQLNDKMRELQEYIAAP
jgi:hypothetical protein